MRKLKALATMIPALAMLAAAGEWGNGSWGYDMSAFDISCGDVDGTYGALDQTWTPGTTSLTTTGAIGAEWKGKQFVVCQNEQKTHTNWITHIYTRTAGAVTSPYLKIEATSSFDIGGSASLWKPISAQWWWDTTVTITEHAPTIQYYVAAQDAWIDVGYTPQEGQDTQASGGGYDASNNNRPDGTSQMSASVGNQGGDTIGVSHLGNEVKARAKMRWTTVAGPVSGDNCDVDEWVKLNFTFKTSWQ